MTAIDRTAYPRPGVRLTREELGVRYDLTEAEIDFIRANARADTSRLLLAVLLKTRRDFGCFPASGDVHAGIVAHVGAQLELTTPHLPTDELRHTSTLYRYHAAIRARLRVAPYDDAAKRLWVRLSSRLIGRVERTLFLLRFIADTDIRRTIRAETTKIEAFNDFLDWVSFGGPVIKSGDPVEQEKQLKYASLVANAVMLSNVADMTTTLAAMDGDGHAVTPALVGCLSPYTREHIRRFGQYSTWATCRRRSICNPCRSRSKREDFCTYPHPNPGRPFSAAAATEIRCSIVAAYAV